MLSERRGNWAYYLMHPQVETRMLPYLHVHPRIVRKRFFAYTVMTIMKFPS